MKSEYKVLRVCLLSCLLVLVGFGAGALTIWATGHYGKQLELNSCQNQTNEEITALGEKVKELQNSNANLTATVVRYQDLLKECEKNLTRSKEQLKEKIKESTQCQQERENCKQQLQAHNNASSLHRDHICWIILSTFCFMLLYN